MTQTISFRTHTLDSAPEAAKPLLEQVKRSNGFVPNVFLVLAEEPAVLKAYLALDQLLGETNYNAAERQLIQLSIAVENRCHYCVAAHTTGAGMAGVDSVTIDAVRGGAPLRGARLQALRSTVQLVVRNRGWVGAEQLEGFFAQGFTKGDLLALVLAVSLKTISNYVNHIAATSLDPSFVANRWEGEHTTSRSAE